MAAELKPCPFCGSKKVRSSIGGNGWGSSFVKCSDCGASIEGSAPCAGKFHNDPAEDKWNRRVPAGVTPCDTPGKLAADVKGPNHG
jgi:Lar family restriction alleviation protein